MKLFYQLLLSIVIVSPLVYCSSAPAGKTAKATDSSYQLTGVIKGMDSGFVYLKHRERKDAPFDSVQIVNGKFTFAGKADTPEYCMLGTKDAGEVAFHKAFFLQNGHLNFTGKKDSLSAATITGEPVQDEYAAYASKDSRLDSFYAQLRTAAHKARDQKNVKATDSIDKIYDSLDRAHQQDSKKYVATHPASYVSALVIASDFSYNPNLGELDSLYQSLDSNIRVSYFGKNIRNVIEKNRLTAIGMSAPEFTQVNAAGKPVTLASLKGNYLLIDFWASWCGPCRQENPAIVKAYKKFHPKKFMIVGISLDDDRSSWLEAVKKDALDWTQLSDLKGWKNDVASAYGINGIPMNFLLDKDGKIVAKGLRGEDLEKKLQALMP